MKKNWIFFIVLSLCFSLQLGMAQRGQYDEEAREQERLEKEQRDAQKGPRKNPFKQFAGGVKQTTVDSATGLLSDTTESTTEDPVTGTLEGARRGTGKVLDNTVKGAVKVATLGYGSVDSYEVVEPPTGKDEPTKIKLKF